MTAPTAPASMDELRVRLERDVIALTASVNAPAGALGVTLGGHAIVAYHGQPRPSEHTAFEVGSITKTITTLLLAEMAARGEVHYDDPIGCYLPRHAVPADPLAARITLAQLATHTAGLPRLPPNMPLPPEDEIPAAIDAGFNPYATYLLDDLYHATAALTPQYPTGQRPVYSIFGIGLLGQLLGNAIGRDWNELAIGRICVPLNMSDTVTHHAPHCAVGHRHGHPVEPCTSAALAASGALRASSADLLAYLHALLHPDSTPLPGPLRQTQQPRAPIEGRESICLGWVHRRFRFGDILFHSGGTFGASAFVGFCPHADVGVFALANGIVTDNSTVSQTPYQLLKDIARQTTTI